jgi:hypothetical protein
MCTSANSQKHFQALVRICIHREAPLPFVYPENLGANISSVVDGILELITLHWEIRVHDAIVGFDSVQIARPETDLVAHRWRYRRVVWFLTNSAPRMRSRLEIVYDLIGRNASTHGV